METPPKITWTQCRPDKTVECGTLSLPVDYSKPDGERFLFTLGRHKASVPAERIGVLLFNPGGPGGSGANTVLELGPVAPREVWNRFDIIGFDPRGTAGSQPLGCSPAEGDHWVFGTPADQRQFTSVRRSNQRARETCRDQAGSLFDHMDSRTVAKDLDNLRKALGEQKISYWGNSYGTVIGQEYVEQFGPNLRAMVLNGLFDRTLDTTSFLTKAAAAEEDALVAFAAWCATKPRCALHGQDVLALWDQLYALAEHDKLMVFPDGKDQPGFPVRLDSFLHTAHDELKETLPYGLATFLATLGPAPKADPNLYPLDGITPIDQAPVVCKDWNFRVRNHHQWQRLVDAERAAAPHVRRSRNLDTFVLMCAGWPANGKNPQHKLTVPTTAPTILLINSLHDATTGHAYAQGVHDQAPTKTVLLTHDGFGHSALGGSECMHTNVTTYLTTLTAPPQNTHCPPYQD